MASPFAYRQELKIPEVFGTKALEIGPHSCYLRWTFLSTHSLSRQQLRGMNFIIRLCSNQIRDVYIPFIQR